MDRQAELEKYVMAYRQPRYRMVDGRAQCAASALNAALSKLPAGSYTLLDVGCGRGELMDIARSLGMSATGTEIVPALITDAVVEAWAHSLPFERDSFDFVTSCDVLEHLVPEDTEKCLSEMHRVARKAVYMTANNRPSNGLKGVELHINRRPYKEWDEMIQAQFTGWKVTWLSDHNCGSEGWLCEVR